MLYGSKDPLTSYCPAIWLPVEFQGSLFCCPKIQRRRVVLFCFKQPIPARGELGETKSEAVTFGVDPSQHGGPCM